MIFASEEEITSKQIKDIVDKSGLRVSISEIEESVNSLNEEFKVNNKPFEILKIAGGYTFATKKEYGRFIGKLFEDKQRKKLSQSALETLSIIAYKQPITRSEIEFIRGVNVDYIVNSLLEKDLITINGRSETPGRPILYGSTKTFLKVLGLNSLDDLPKLKEINEILKNQEIEGITEADIELFNSVNNPENIDGIETVHQLELLTNEEINIEETNEIENEEDDDIEVEDTSDIDLTSEIQTEDENLSYKISDEITNEANETLNEDFGNVTELNIENVINSDKDDKTNFDSVPENATEIIINENEEDVENEVENELDNMSEKDFENTINSGQKNTIDLNNESTETDNEDKI